MVYTRQWIGSRFLCTQSKNTFSWGPIGEIYPNHLLTIIPFSTRAFEMAAPTPTLAPVTTATFPTQRSIATTLAPFWWSCAFHAIDKTGLKILDDLELGGKEVSEPRERDQEVSREKAIGVLFVASFFAAPLLGRWCFRWRGGEERWRL